MSPFYNLEMQRLRLGRIRQSDIPLIVSYANNKNISDNVLTLPYPYTEENALQWIKMSEDGFEKEKDYIFGIYLNETDEFIGGIGLHTDKAHFKAELGYWIAEPFWNKGFASEAGIEILKFGFESLNLNKIYASHFLFNPASEKVLQKIGMTKEATLKDHYFKNGKFETVGLYCVLRIL